MGVGQATRVWDCNEWVFAWGTGGYDIQKLMFQETKLIYALTPFWGMLAETEHLLVVNFFADFLASDEWVKKCGWLCCSMLLFWHLSWHTVRLLMWNRYKAYSEKQEEIEESQESLDVTSQKVFDKPSWSPGSSSLYLTQTQKHKRCYLGCQVLLPKMFATPLNQSPHQWTCTNLQIRTHVWSARQHLMRHEKFAGTIAGNYW